MKRAVGLFCCLLRFFRQGALQQWVTTVDIIAKGMAAVIAMTVTGIATIGAIGIAMTAGTAIMIETTTAASELLQRRVFTFITAMFLAIQQPPLKSKARLSNGGLTREGGFSRSKQIVKGRIVARNFNQRKCLSIITESLRY